MQGVRVKEGISTDTLYASSHSAQKDGRKEGSKHFNKNLKEIIMIFLRTCR